MKKAQIKMGKIFLPMVIAYIGMIILSFHYKNSFNPFLYYLLIVYSVYIPILTLLIVYFRPLLIEKLNLDLSEKIIFDAMYTYVVFLPFLAVIWILPFGNGKKFFFEIISFISFIFLTFCVLVIISLLEIKKAKKEHFKNEKEKKWRRNNYAKFINSRY